MRTVPNPEDCIPKWYRFGMTRQIAVRLPDDLVDYIDGLVADGQAKSRAAVVTRALTREQRRAAAERDALIYAQGPPDDEFADMAEYARTLPLELD